MKLISCEDCGVVIDLDRIEWKAEKRPANEYISELIVRCPACNAEIVIDGD